MRKDFVNSWNARTSKCFYNSTCLCNISCRIFQQLLSPALLKYYSLNLLHALCVGRVRAHPHGCPCICPDYATRHTLLLSHVCRCVLRQVAIPFTFCVLITSIDTSPIPPSSVGTVVPLRYRGNPWYTLFLCKFWDYCWCTGVLG